MKNANIRKFLYWIPALIVMIIIFYFSSKTGTESNSQSDPIVLSILRTLHLSENIKLFITLLVRKFGHISEFALLGFCVSFALTKSFSLNWFKTETYAILISYIYALTDELHQLFVPERSGRFSDTLIDLVGIVIGSLLFVLVYKLWSKFIKKEK